MEGGGAGKGCNFLVQIFLPAFVTSRGRGEGVSTLWFRKLDTYGTVRYRFLVVNFS
jgi:hypothetical protein